MTGECWLVTLCHSMDDFPIKLCNSHAEAVAFVAANPIVDVEPSKSKRGMITDWTSGPEVMDSYNVAGIDAATPLGFKIWHFVDGKPVGYELAGWID